MATAEWDDLRAAQSRKYLTKAHNDDVRARMVARRCRKPLDDLEHPKGVSYEGRDMPGSPNAYGDAIPDAVAAADEQQRTAAPSLEEWQRSFTRAWDILNQMDDPYHSELLYQRVLMGRTWQETAQGVGYSQRWCQEHERAALVELYAYLPFEWRIPRQPAI